MVNIVTFLGISILVQWMLAPAFRIIGSHMPGRYIYFWFYCAHEVVTDILILFVIREMYRKVYGSNRALPSWVPANVRTRVILTAVTSCCLTSLFSVTNGLGNYGVLVRAEGFAATLLFLLFWVLAIFANSIGLGFPGRVAQIATGFVLYMTINLFSVSFRGQFGPEAPMWAQMLGSMAYIASLGKWCWTARKKEVTINISPEQWNTLVQEFSKL